MIHYLIAHSNPLNATVFAGDTREEVETYSATLPKEFSAHVVVDEGDMRSVPLSVMTFLYNTAQPPEKQIAKFEKKMNAIPRVFNLLPVLCQKLPPVKPQNLETDTMAQKAKKAAAPKKAPAAKKAAAPKKAPVEKKVANGEQSPARGQRLGIGKFMADMIRKNKTTEEILAAVHKEFPTSRAKSGDVSIARGKVQRGVL